ncbi:MAG: hypothetical protein U5K27_15750 [Desulfotignum sp.]|nr:hypothetical protein [Desulfotignum sp.]
MRDKTGLSFSHLCRKDQMARRTMWPKNHAPDITRSWFDISHF